MKLIGFTFIDSQENFEKWQLENEDFTLHSVLPVASEIDLGYEKRYEQELKGNAKWGVFVTYSYEK